MVEIKICGFTRRQDIDDALALGIKIIGLNFYPESPRYVSLQKAKELLSGIKGGTTTIGVFVNPEEEDLFQIVSSLNLSGVQLHGDEPPSLIENLRKELPGKIFIKGLRVRDRKGLEEDIKRYSPDFYLLDAYDRFIPGGTGKRIETSLLDGLDIIWEKVFLAGGITPDNVKGILKIFHPYGIDVASGVESSPGIKDRRKMEALIKNIQDIK